MVWTAAGVLLSIRFCQRGVPGALPVRLEAGPPRRSQRFDSWSVRFLQQPRYDQAFRVKIMQSGKDYIRGSIPCMGSRYGKVPRNPLRPRNFPIDPRARGTAVALAATLVSRDAFEHSRKEVRAFLASSAATV